jgi:hypothetical protein
VTPASSVQLDPGDAEDRKIIARQVKAARQAGRDGRDRAGSTRGRVDLEQAFDAGASEAEAAVSAPAATPAAAPAPGGRPASPAPAGKSGGPGAWTRFRKMGPGWQSVKPTSPARLPTRVQDAGGFLTGLALYTVVIIYVRYGQVPQPAHGRRGEEFHEGQAVDGEGEQARMNPTGIIIAIAGVWLVVQVTAGDMLGRLNLL